MTKKETAKFVSDHRIDCECDPDRPRSDLLHGGVNNNH